MGVITVSNPGKSTRITTATTTQVKIGTGVLKRIIIGTTAAGTITIYDEVGSGTTNVIAVLKASIGEGVYAFDIQHAVGIKIVTGAASDITVVYE